MSNIDIRRKHTRPLKEARAAVERVAEHIAEKFDVEYGWNGNTMDFSRGGVDGHIAVSGKEIHTGQLFFDDAFTRDPPLPRPGVRLGPVPNGSGASANSRRDTSRSRRPIASRKSPAPPRASNAANPRSRNPCSSDSPAARAGSREARSSL